MVHQGYLIEIRPKFTSQTNNCDTVMLKAYSPVHMHCKRMYAFTHLHMYVCMYEYGYGYNLSVCRFFCRNQKSTWQNTSPPSLVIREWIKWICCHHVASPHHHDWCPDQQHAQRTGHGRISVPKKGTARPRPMRLQSEVGDSGAASTSLFCNLFEKCRSWKECHVVCSRAVIEDPVRGIFTLSSKSRSRCCCSSCVRMQPGLIADIQQLQVG